MHALDLLLCRLLNHANRREYVGRFFALISRLGDGVLWYALMLILPLLHGISGLLVSVHMGLTGLVCLIVYKWLKATTSRPRPFMVSESIVRRTPPLDEYSFPSGHTLHAVAFSLVLLSHLPEWFWVVIPFSVLVAASRPVLGLHYPSDVLAGAIIGAFIAGCSISLTPVPGGFP
ncbi:phosphatase PAP2 family protein [Thioalkalivibrio denitrificans]|uniref:undecaprenyl-diphosphate phosphatase n=1 Tax=Thioalkalivibrio denitrificans TaxID=108003 RepID=A0A1V3NGK4_9GAMM|nr:phosphatase PAP2 family protein [Thioalkalivibrio denitrificans]OOG24053.1 phosphatase PAP2 family protein [Thioalkalivibrio denitrificans]